MPPGWHEGRDHDEGPIKPLEVWGYADLVLDLTPGTGRVGLIRETPRLEAVLGKTHRMEFERGCRKRELWSDEDPAPPSKERRSETPDLRLCAPVLYSTIEDARRQDSRRPRLPRSRLGDPLDPLLHRGAREGYYRGQRRVLR